MARTSTARKIAPKAPASRFTVLSDLVARDETTKLEWTRKKFGEFTFKKAQAHIDSLNAEKHGGHADWRLPTVEELFCLADRTRSAPAIDTDVFECGSWDWFWSGTPYAPVSGCAWGVTFHYGGSDGLNRDYDYFVRAVRASQSSASRRSAKGK